MSINKTAAKNAALATLAARGLQEHEDHYYKHTAAHTHGREQIQHKRHGTKPKLKPSVSVKHFETRNV